MKFIDFENKNKKPASQKDQIVETDSCDIKNNIELIKEQNENKILFSIGETARILNVSYDFVRENILGGKISFVPFGDRRMMHIHEIARLITYGV